MEILRKENLNENTRSLFFTSKEIYIHDELPLSFFEPRGVELGSGEHSFEFSIPLEENLPSSFKGSYGSIKYKLRIVIQKPWTFDEKHIIPLTIVKRMVLPSVCRLNPISLTKQTTRTISLFGNRPVSLVAILPEDCAVRGKNMQLQVIVTNNSNTNVEKLKFTILQLITYCSHMPLRNKKKEILTIFSKETGCVQKKTERTFAHELLVPACQPTDESISSVINISYEVKVDAVLRGFYKNLVLNLPFTVYSDDSQQQAQNGGNPFEASYPVVNQQDLNYSTTSSISSPSHSSQYSESSSLHSTTSDSSAATLSPAVGSNLSYSSQQNDSPPQFSSPSARSSVRSSLIPYIQYQDTSNDSCHLTRELANSTHVSSSPEPTYRLAHEIPNPAHVNSVPEPIYRLAHEIPAPTHVNSAPETIFRLPHEITGTSPQYMLMNSSSLQNRMSQGRSFELRKYSIFNFVIRIMIKWTIYTKQNTV